MAGTGFSQHEIVLFGKVFRSASLTGEPLRNKKELLIKRSSISSVRGWMMDTAAGLKHFQTRVGQLRLADAFQLARRL